MASRIMYIGDTYPPLRFQLAQGQQVLDLRPATSITLEAEGSITSFGGPCTPLWPFQPDPNGMVRYNLEYPFSVGDTSKADTFKLWVTVTWNTGVQTFTTTDQLIVEAKS